MQVTRIAVEDITCGKKASSFPRKTLYKFLLLKTLQPLSKWVVEKCCKEWVKPFITYFEREEKSQVLERLTDVTEPNNTSLPPCPHRWDAAL